MNKKIIVLIMFILFTPSLVYAEEEKVVTLSNCVDATSARFIYNKQEIKTKFIGIERSEEYTIENIDDEISGKTVDEYVCDLLSNAKKITIEYDSKIELKDKFDRENVWLFVDGELLESHLVSLGYVKVAYLYDDYKYNDELLEKEKYAKENKLGIWSKKEEEEPIQNEEPKKEESKDFFSIVGDFFLGIFEAIGNFFSGLSEGTTNE